MDTQQNRQYKKAPKSKGKRILAWCIAGVIAAALLVGALLFFLHQDTVINTVYDFFHPRDKGVFTSYLPQGNAQDDAPGEGPQATTPPQGGESDVLQRDGERLVISAVGDLAVHGQQLSAAQKGDTYDFNGCFAAVAPYLQQSDLVIGDLYTTVAGGEMGYTGYPKFNTPASFLTALKQSGFDVLITANDRAFDYGWLGVEKTMENIRAAGMTPVGTYPDAESYYEPTVLDVNGFRVAVLAYTDSVEFTDGISEDKQSFCIKQTNEATILRDVSAAREKGAEIVIVSMHWGKVDSESATGEDRALAETLLTHGVDLIIGTHPQRLQGITRKTFTQQDGSEKEGLVAYSLGNFISNRRNRYNDTGLILSVEFVRDETTGAVTMGEATAVPTWIYAADTEVESEKDFQVLPLYQYLNDEQAAATLYSSALARMKQAWDEVTTLLGDAVTVLQQ